MREGHILRRPKQIEITAEHGLCHISSLKTNYPNDDEKNTINSYFIDYVKVL